MGKQNTAGLLVLNSDKTASDMISKGQVFFKVRNSLSVSNVTLDAASLSVITSIARIGLLVLIQ